MLEFDFFSLFSNISLIILFSALTFWAVSLFISIFKR